MKLHLAKILAVVCVLGLFLALCDRAEAGPRTQMTADVINKLNGSPKWVGAISATTGVVCLNIHSGQPHIINCGANAFFRADVATGTVATSSTNMGLPIEASKNVYFTTEDVDTRVCVILASGTTTCNVWECK